MNSFYFFCVTLVLSIFPQIFAQNFITVTSPNGGESWQAGSSQVISWNDNLSENVKIELFKGGSFHSLISISTTSDGNRTWNIPLSLASGSNYSIKISSVDSATVFDFSDANFTVYPPVITVTDPNGGENWIIGDSYLITWTDNIVENVELQLYKGGSFNTSITTSTTSDGSFTWIVPGGTIPGSDYKIRIASVDNSNIFDESNANFTLASQITVVSPNNNENWRTGTVQSITWSDNISENVNIELYKNGSFHSNIVSSTPSTGSYLWTIPGTVTAGSNYKVKISSVSDPSTSDLSDANFSIFVGNITITSPNGGESWQAGTTQNITWTDNITENVTIDLYKGGAFHSIISTSTSSDGLKSWNIPFTLESGTDYKVKVTSVDGSDISDLSNSNFTIVGNQLTVTTPNGGENWQPGTSQIISWTDNFSSSVEIQLFKSGAYHSSIISSTPSDGSYTWNIPGTILAGSDYTIKILSTVDGNIFDFSNASFTIINNDITVSSPNGGEIWLTSSTQTITWTDNISGNVKIELYQAEVFKSTIVTSTPSDGSYFWNIPGGTATGSNYKVKITSVALPTLSDLSDNNFTIFTAQIAVTSPNGGESWQAGSNQNITWTDNISENVKIELYKGVVLHSEIDPSTSSDGSKSWNLPFTLQSGSDYKIKITSVNDPGISDLSNSNFTVVGNQITLLTPNGGEGWTAGTSQIISWTDNLTGSVEIQLLKGGVFNSSITTSTTSDGSYTWNIPGNLIAGSDYKIKILSAEDGNIFDLSNANFTIINSNLTIDSPNGGENWLTGNTEVIFWTDDISGNVKIELYKAEVFNSTIVSSTASDGSYVWNIPGSLATGSNYKIKISSISQPTLFDLSDDNFTIFTGQITVTSPNGGESWQAGSTQNLTWTDNILGNVTIDLYKAGVFHSVISSSTTSDGLKSWIIPYALQSGSDYSVKITSLDDPSLFDFSNSNFTIIGNQVTITSPNGGENLLVDGTHLINWSDNFLDDVEIKLYKGGVFYSLIAGSDPSDGEYTWNIPPTITPGKDYKIRVSSTADGNIFDESNTNFSISHQITVTFPNGGNSLLAGHLEVITWIDNIPNSELVKIELHKGGSLQTVLFDAEDADGAKNWTIDPAITPGTDYRIKVISVNDNTVFDISDTDFTIARGTITVSSPNGGESWQAGNLQAVTWADDIVGNVMIDLYKGGVLHSNIIASTVSDGAYSWSLPFTLPSGTDYKVKITSIGDPNVLDFSDANFTIIGNQVTVTSPNGGENWAIGSSQIINWTDNLTGNVEIQLLKGGSFHSSIIASTTSDGTYTWNIPASVPAGSDYRVKIVSTIDASVFDESDANFTLSSELIVTTPNGAESWQAGSTQTISWTDNISENVKIELFRGVIFDSQITPSTPSTGSYIWNIPLGTVARSNYRIKITSVNNASLFDFSDANFEIFTGVITVSSPNGGESWAAGTTQPITWTDNISENIIIDLYKGGVFHSVISTSTTSDGTRNWNIPFAIESGTDYTVKITSVNTQGTFDFSDANFTIVGNEVTVTSPNGGDNWTIGSSQIINWTDNLTGSVEIQLLKGGSFHSSITGSTPSDGSYTWNIPVSSEAGIDYGIKIISVDDGNIFDQSDANFTLSNELTVTTPNGGESWQSGSLETISWTDNISGNIKIELFRGGILNSLITASTPSNGSFIWDIPAGISAGTNYTIKITSADNASVFDFSDANFEIFTGTITVTSPNGGESWAAGTTRPITWTDNISENITIDLYKGGIFHSIISTSTTSDGTRNWNIPFAIESGTDYTVKITSVNNPSTFDFSNANFTIVGNQVTVTSPNGGENWTIGSSQIITWTDNLTGSVEIQLLKGGSFHSSITGSTPSDGSYTWNIPISSEAGIDYGIKIISVDDGNIFDQSDANFTLSNELIVTTPNGGESWQVGSSQTMNWIDNISGNIKIELFKGGILNSLITASTPSNGSFIWDIPVGITAGLNYTIKITSIDNPSLFDFSDANFEIFTGVITVTSPNSGENLPAGTSTTITWTDNIGENVQIDLYKGGALHSVISASTSSDGSKIWDIPFALESGSDYQVKISSINNPVITDFSDANFTIVGNQITVTAPNGGENWKIGSSQVITWTDNLTGSVEIQLFKGGIFSSSITGSTPSDGAYTWNIPTSLIQASDYSIKLSSVDDGNVFDQSDLNFTLSNEIIVNSPNGAESWQAGTSHIIVWTDNINGNVKIELFRGGVFNSLITTSTPSNGSYGWDIPAGIAAGLNYTIKITSVNDAAIFDFSDANFEIFEGIITVTSPNGGESWQAGTAQNITWTDNINENITIDLFKAGVFHSIISTSTGSDGSRNWVVPFTLESGTDYTVKVTSVDDPSITDISDANFTVIGNEITLTAPNGGEQWLDNENQLITWTDNLAGSVELQLYRNDVFHSSITTSTPSDGEYTWNIPGSVAAASNYKIKIISVDDGNVFDLSDGNFTIINNEITVISPNGGENWLTGTSQNITWSDNIAGDVKIELYKSEVFDSEIAASAPSNGSYIWDIPAGIATGSDYKIKITSIDLPVLSDISNSSFTIFTGQITVISPDGGESWQAGSSQNVTWTDNIIEAVTIDLYKGGAFHSVISASTSSDGLKTWDIPFAIESGSDYQVQITSVNNPGITDLSNANFTIIGNQVTVTSPNGGEDWQIGSSQIITWTDNFTGNVEIQLFKGGIFHSAITGSTPSDGAYTWNISSSLIQASDYSIRISSVNDGNVFDFSDAEFTLSNQLIVTIPNGGESWQRGTTHTIRWTDNISGNVKIELYRGVNTFDSQITPSTPSNGSYVWDIPVGTTAITNYRIKITSVENSSIFDFSDANFEIFEGIITVTSPNGAESWTAGTTQNITWADNINENVTIDLYKGGVFHSNISTSTSSDGSRNWDIPFTLEAGTDYKVKITSVDDPSITDISDANFAIIGNQITVTTPNGGEQWLDNEDQIISWTDNLTGSVEIQLFKNDLFHSSITTSTPSDGEYTWNIPGTTPSGTDYKVKMISSDDGNIFDLSDGSFTIINNEITVISPNGGESWLTGTSQNINWSDNIAGDVKIELYKSEVFDSEIAALAPSNGSYIWDIPAGIATGSDYKVKITSIDQPVLSDISNSSFTIFTGQITVTSPNGVESWQAGSSQNVTWTDNISGNVTIDLYKGGSFHSEISTSTSSDGSKVWDIPFALESGTDYKVRITSVDDPGTFDLSNANFTIVGNQVAVTSPNGGEDWQVGSSQIITWTDNFTGNVEIQLFKSGIFHSSITGSTPSDGAYTWNISSSLIQASDYSIRISSIDDGNVFDFSDADFTLSNQLIVTVPNGGESWQRGTTHTIRWTDNISGNVKIELYRGVNTFDSQITPSTPSNGSYVWDIPVGTTARTNYRIKITSLDNSSIFDFSDANFEIFEGIITITSPNGAESWTAGTTQNITWADNINENVIIDLYKGGVFHSNISTSTSSDGSRNWDIPFTLEAGTDYKVKITSVDDPSITDISDANFAIIGNQITVTTPNGGEQWLDNEDQIISWTDNLTGSVEIQLFKNDLFHSSITTSTPSDGEYTWNIPGTTPSGTDYKVKMISSDDGNIFDLSDGSFTIINNEITVISPNGGESWLTGTSQNINWSDNIAGDVKIELYKSEVFDSEIAALAPSNGSYIWDIPAGIATGSDYKVKITSIDQPVLSDISNSSFTIFTGQITVTSPNGVESWQAGSSQNVTWTDNISGNVTIDLYKGGSFHSEISTSTSSDGSKVWDIPFALESGTDYKVRITSVDDPGTFDLSNANFTIVGNQVAVTSPNGGEDWQVGSSQIITWTDNFTGNVEIQLFKGGIFHSSITSSTPSDGAYTWNISSSLIQASDYSIRISSVDDGNVFDFSDAEFTLSNQLIVTVPNGGESWQRGTTHTIRWTDNISGNVKIELYRGINTFDSQITPSTPSNGSYVWDIPVGTTARTNYRIKITSLDNSSIFDFSDANFEIFEGIITITSPNGAESWTAGTTQNITWADNINENVTIDLYKGGVFHSNISTSTGSDGSRNWDIPFTLEAGTDYKVKITSVDDPSITDISDANFAIVGNQITVTTPNGGEQWLDNEDQIISWTDNLTGSVEIQLFKNDLFHSSITTSTPSDGEYTWNIPGTTPSGTDYKVKMISSDDGNIFDLSDGSFTIINNEITVISPNGGESWLTGTSQNINWSDNIAGDVKIELYKSEVFDSEIAASAPSNGSFIWDIPAGIATGSDYKVKITSIDQPVLSDISNSSFTIFTGQITVTSPNGGESWQAGSSQNVTWTDNINGNVTIDLYKGGSFHSEISTSTSSDGSKVWDIPFALESGTDYKVRITSVDDPGTFDLSNANFTIVGNQVAVTSPNGGEDWQVGSSEIITWTDNFTGNVEIQLFKSGIFHSSITGSTPSDGAYTWNISSSLIQASDYSIRISSIDDGNVFDFSDADFTLSNQLIVTVPNGGESWQRGTTHTIRWTDNISGNVKIELYRGVNTFDSQITPSTPSNGSYVWDIPVGTTARTNYRIKITSLDNSSIFDFSDANFEIFEGIITITSPNGAESWTAGTTQNITWADNINENVIIDLYKGGVFHSNISTSTGSDGSRNWDIPFTLEAGTDYKVKITSVDDPSITDISDANFAIVGNQITVTTPNGGEQWLDNEDQIISWTDNLTGSVEIQLFKNDLFHSSITTSTPSDGEYTWNIPGTTPSGTDYKVKIISSDDGNIFDLSNGSFTIISNDLTVTSPNGGESWLTGTLKTITWTDDIDGDVKIDLYKAGVINLEITAAAPSNGTYTWNIPGTIADGSDYKIWITSVDQPDLYDISNSNFAIFTGNITVSSPDGGESWQAGTTQSITWIDNITENVTIDLYKGGTFHSVISTSTGSDGSRNWDIPFALESGTNYKVKITSAENPGIFDLSDANFTIVANQVAVTSPNGGEDWLVGSSQIITWTDNLIGIVEIQLFKGGVFHSSITTSTSSDGEYTWNISNSLVQGSDYRIRISSVDDGNILDFSDDFFTLSNEVIVTIPNGGESWQQGTTHTINWTDNLVENVNIELYKGGIFDSEITASAPSSGSFSWDIPVITAAGTDYSVKITSVNNSSVFDFSDANFEIFEGNITVTSPNGSENWIAGTTQNITWTDNINEEVTIDLYKGGVFHSIVSTSTSSDGSRNWDIPFTLEAGTDYTIKITSVDDPGITDISDVNFTIVGNEITITTPNGGEQWLDTEDQIIAWTDNLTGSVEIQLFKNDLFHSSITTSTASDGEYTWNIPGATPSASDYKIKIISLDDGNIFDLSDNEFTIISNELTVTAPNGGESWLTGTSHDITWTDDIIGNIKIELYKSGVFNSTISSSTLSNGLYVWEIPAGLSNGSDYSVKITSVDQPELFDMSNNNFTIFTGNITVSSPDGGESWQAGTTQSITWSDNITENITIDLYKGGTFNSVISTSTGSDGSRNWDIPFTLESGIDYKVKITSVENPAIFDFSDANFTIAANQVTVTSPNGGEDYLVGSSHIITWNDNLIGNVEIQIFKGGVFHSSITTSTTSDGEYTWNISNTLVQASDYRIRISSVDDGNILDFSDDDFTLSNEVIVTIPNGGESWQQGTSHTINWSDNLVENVKIELFKGGIFDSEITPSAPSNGSFSWDIPLSTAAGIDYTVKITSVNNPSVFDFSDTSFEIFEGNITITSPNGGENWTAGTTQIIRWTDNINENVIIDLYKGGAFHSIITTSTGSDGSRSWDIPFTLESGTDYKVKITSIDDPSITDFSDANFTIVENQIIVVTPNGGEEWLDTEDQIISWADNLGGSVEIQLLKGGVFHSSISTSTPSDGSYTWNIPGTTPSGSDYKINIFSVDDGNISDLSDNDFTIINNDITVTAPNGGESWLTGSTKEITWFNANSGDVKIELYKNEVFNLTIADNTPGNGSYFWDVPESITTGSDYKIKITSVNQSAIFDFSNNTFTIFTGDITVTSPNGGENWQAGTSQNITWTDNIPENIAIDLYKAGSFHSVISTTTGSDGSKIWDIPFALESGSDYKIRITSIENTDLFDFSDADFTIIGNQVSLTSPIGGENWAVGTSQIISWIDNLAGNIEIQLFKDDNFHSSITGSTPSDGQYTWNISSTLVQGSDYKIRLSSVDDGNVFDLSDDDFTLTNDITVILPNGGESWQAGTQHNITWGDNITGNVRIELFKDGIFDSEITASTASSGSFAWNIPTGTAADSTYKIKILNVDNTAVFDFSDANFEIFEGKITVTNPNGGEVWQAGTTQNINWTDNINENVTIDLYKDGEIHSIISTATASDGSKSWNIPFTLESGTDFSVKITSVDDENIYDFSDTEFNIEGIQITVTSPNGGENWLDTEDQLITWTDNLTGNVEIQLLKNDLFHSSITTSTPSDGEYTWNIPGTTPSATDYKIKIISVDDGNVNDVSDGDFTIISDDLTVTTPNGGENWLIGTTQTIRWTDDIDSEVKIELYQNELPYFSIVTSVASEGFYNWSIPDTTTQGSNYKIKISSVDQPGLFDMSNSNFTLFNGSIQVLSPNGGENWQAGTSQPITWLDNITEDVTIDLYKGGSFHSIISTLTGSDGSKIWNIPFDLQSGSDYKVKITNVDNQDVFDFSDSNFTILGNQVVVTSPNGGEDFLIGSSHIITWTDNLSGNVEIQLFKNDIFNSSITTSTASDGEYTWNISNNLIQGSDYKIRISSVTDGNILDFSDQDFTLSSEIIVAMPNGGENWQAGTSQVITWTDNLNENVKIELFKSGIFDSEIEASTPSNGSFTWDIPANKEAGLDYTVKISSVNNASIFDFSNAEFEISFGSVTVTTPNGGENWQAGTTQTINWTDDIPGNVSIELFKGGSFNSIISALTGSDGSKTWDIPFNVESASNYSVKVTSLDDPNIFDFSDADFTIIGNQISVTYPNGGENLLENDDHSITWTDNLLGNVEIQLLKGGVFHSSITSSTPSDGQYAWNISGSIESSSDYQLKIISIEDGSIFDLSDANFTIINNFISVITPNGGESWLLDHSYEIAWTDDIVGNVRIELFEGDETLITTIANSIPSVSPYIWNIPESVIDGNNYKLKISSVDQPTLYDMSNSNFSLSAGSIRVASPNGGESLLAGEQYTVTWSDNITGDVKIQLFKDGSEHSVIIESTPSDGSKNWDIPFDIESDTTYKIKITSLGNENIFDFSDFDFTIEGFSIAVVAPNGGENWFAGSAVSVTWNSNLTGNVEIQLFKGVDFHSIITGSTSNDGSYSWNISPSLTTDSDYKIKIASVNDADIFDFSDAEFTIISNNITITSPDGGENWLIGSTHEITWSDDISGNVQIDLYKGGIFDTTIVASTASDGSFDWNFAGLNPGSDYRVKVTSIVQPALFDMSNNDFTLFAGEITVASPNGGENWQAGSAQTVFWTDNISGDVTIELHKADTLHSVISGPTSSDGAKDWTVPFDLESGDDYKVKITSVDNTEIFDFSDANFNIEGFEVTINSPNGEEIWYVGNDYNITWTDNLTGSVEIHLWKGGVFHSVIDASDPSDGIKTWSIPPGQETGSDFTIKIASLDNSNIFDFSDNTFSLVHQIVVESPNGGESWQAGSDKAIAWSDNLTGNIRIELWNEEAFHSVIESSALSSGNYTWSIDAGLQASANYKIKIVSVENANVFDFSDDNFEIFAGSISLVSPNGGEIWQAGTDYSINWISDISENVKIELYKGGSLHSTIAASTGNDGTYSWTEMPFTTESGSDYQVRISSVTNSNTFDLSNGEFTIVGNQITITSPNGGEQWVIGEPYFITWEDNLSGSIAIYLLKGAQIALIIDGSDASDGSYGWTIPANVQPGSDYKIQIESRDNGNIHDLSDAEFTITDVVSVQNITNEIPDIYQLYQNYPNPFNPQTKIEFGLPEESTVSLKIYDLTGQQVDVVLDNENLYAGTFRFDFDASYLPSGIYFYILIAKSNLSDLAIKETKKMILMK